MHQLLLHTKHFSKGAPELFLSLCDLLICSGVGSTMILFASSRLPLLIRFPFLYSGSVYRKDRTFGLLLHRFIVTTFEVLSIKATWNFFISGYRFSPALQVRLAQISSECTHSVLFRRVGLRSKTLIGNI